MIEFILYFFILWFFIVDICIFARLTINPWYTYLPGGTVTTVVIVALTPPNKHIEPTTKGRSGLTKC